MYSAVQMIVTLIQIYQYRIRVIPNLKKSWNVDSDIGFSQQFDMPLNKETKKSKKPLFNH